MRVAPTRNGVDLEAYARAQRAAGRPVALDLGCGANKVPGAWGVDGICTNYPDRARRLVDASRAA